MTRMNKAICRVPLKGERAGGMRVLCYAEAWGQGGIETFLMDLFRRCQGKDLSFSLYSCWEWNDAFDNELAALGIDRYTVFRDQKPGQAKRLQEGSAAFVELLDELRPDAVYVNTMNGMGFLYSQSAKKSGVPTRVVHSHNSALGSGQAAAKVVMHNLGKAAFGRSATACIACSAAAGRHLFGSREFVVMNNGIDTGRFAFDPAARIAVRESFGIPVDALLFGSVGKLAEVKNPLFQIRTFAEILRLEPSAYYLMVGEGDMEARVKQLVCELGLKGRVITPGYFPDPAPVYSALDCFLMPSLFEGLAMSCVEAQAAGCPILCSTALPAEAHVTNLEHILPLNDGEAKWAETAVALLKECSDRSSYAIKVKDAGFDAGGTATKLTSLFLAG